MTIAVIGIIIMLALIFLGVDIGISMLIVGFFGYMIITNPTAALGVLRQVPVGRAMSFGLSVVPLFMIMGNVAFAAGVSDGLFAAADKWLRRLPGGLSCATIAGCAGFGAVCGSTVATAATMGTVAIPTMRKYGYDDSLSTGSVAVGGTLGIMIPPSTTFIVYGIMTEQSIGKLFAAGIIPGVITALLFIVSIVLRVKLNPSLAPPPDKSITWKERLYSLKHLIWIGILFAIVFGGMFSGFTTVNESAALGAGVAIVIMVIRRKFTWQAFVNVMKNSIKTAAMVYMILVGAEMFGKFLAITRLPMTLSDAIKNMAVSPYIILLIIILIYVVMGCFMDALPMITLTIPIFIPIILTLGFDPIWFGVVCVLVVQVGLITPPIGLNCFVIAGIAKDVPLPKIFKGALPFIPALLVAIVLTILIPNIALWLPNLFYV